MALFDFLNGGMSGSGTPNITPGQLGDQPVGDMMTPGSASQQPGLLSNLTPQSVGQAGGMLRDPQQQQQAHPQAPQFGDALSQTQSGQQQRMMALVQQLLGGR